MRRVLISALILLVCLSLTGAALAVGRGLSSGQIAYAGWRGSEYHIFLLDVAHGLRHSLTTLDAEPCCLTFSPNGEYLAYLSSLNGGYHRLHIVRWDGLRLPEPTSGYVASVRPQWFPGSSTLAFVTLDSGFNMQAVQIRLPDGELNPLPTLSGQLLYPVWSPDATRFAFVSADRLYLAPANCLDRLDACPTFTIASGSTQVMGWPAWSPDGTRLIFAGRSGGQESYLFLVEAACAASTCPEPRQLTLQSRTYTGAALWSQEGHTVTFLSDREGVWAIYALDMRCLDTPQGCAGQERRLSQNDTNAYAASWSPDGRQLVFVTQRRPGAGDTGMAIQVWSPQGQRRLVSRLFFNPAPVWWPGLAR